MIKVILISCNAKIELIFEGVIHRKSRTMSYLGECNSGASIRRRRKIDPLLHFLWYDNGWDGVMIIIKISPELVDQVLRHSIDENLFEPYTNVVES